MVDEFKEIPRPQKSDRLFVGRDDWYNNAIVSHTDYSNFPWSAYGEGYKQAADIIVNHINEQGRAGIDFLVYPVIFLYRHYLELMLKVIILDGTALLNITYELPKVHSLAVLWSQCRKIMEQVWVDGDKDDLDAIDEIIEQICKVDPKSMSFRYPIDKQGNRSMKDLEVINLMNFSEIIDKVALILEGSALGISVYLEHKQEREAEYLEQ